MCRSFAMSITVNDITYYEKETLIAAFVVGLILFIIGVIRLLRCKKGAFLKYRDSKYYDAPLNDTDTNDNDEYIREDEQKLHRDEQIFNELIKNEQIDEEINELEYEPDDYVFPMSARVFFVAVTSLLLAAGLMLMGFAAAAKDMDDHEAEHGDEKITIYPPEKNQPEYSLSQRCF